MSVNVSTYVQTYVHTYVYTFKHTCIHVFEHIDTCVCIYTYSYACIFATLAVQSILPYESTWTCTKSSRLKSHCERCFSVLVSALKRRLCCVRHQRLGIALFGDAAHVAATLLQQPSRFKEQALYLNSTHVYMIISSIFFKPPGTNGRKTQHLGFKCYESHRGM